MPWLRRWTIGFCLALFLVGNAGAAPPATAASEASPPLYHGNWCGAGDAHRGRAVDALDAACRVHDLCYEKRGRGACTCDRALLKATAALVRNPKIEETVRSKAATVNSLFSAALCIEPRKNRRTARNR